MPPAARTGDLTEHGTPLGPGLGSPNVSFGGSPAWRVTDVHACPQMDSPTKPHVGGVVAQGSGKVFINKLPAARQGDFVVEAGKPNQITQGLVKVNLGG